MFTELLQALEAHDTLPAGEALSRVLESEATLAASFTAQPGADQLLEAWAAARLEGMHQLKCLALEAALRADPSGQDRRAMAQSALNCLRQAVHEHPELGIDAHQLSQLSQQGHPLAFTQVAAVLTQQAPQVLPADSEQLAGACGIASWALGRIYDPSH